MFQLIGGATSRGETYKELASGIKFDLETNKSLVFYFGLITEYFNNAGLSMDTKIYLNSCYKVRKEFREIANSFDTEIEFVKFGSSPINFSKDTARKMNEWMETTLNTKVGKCISASSLCSDTELVLLNIVQFKGRFLKPFNPSGNFKSEFYVNETDTVEVDYMRYTVSTRNVRGHP